MYETWKEKRDQKITTGTILALTLVFIMILAYILKDDMSNIPNITTPILTFAGGAVGGYGFGAAKKRKKPLEKKQ